MVQVSVGTTPQEVKAKVEEIHTILYSLAQTMPPGDLRFRLNLENFCNNHPDVARAVAKELLEKEARHARLVEAFKPKRESKVFSEEWLEEARRIITHHVRMTNRQTFTYKELDRTAHALGSYLTGKDLFPRAFELAHYKNIIKQIRSHPHAIYKVPDEKYQKILQGGSL